MTLLSTPCYHPSKVSNERLLAVLLTAHPLIRCFNWWLSKWHMPCIRLVCGICNKLLPLIYAWLAPSGGNTQPQKAQLSGIQTRCQTHFSSVFLLLIPSHFFPSHCHLCVLAHTLQLVFTSQIYRLAVTLVQGEARAMADKRRHAKQQLIDF